MEIRKANEKDLDRIMEIVEQARDYFRSEGIPQWQDGYPAREDFRNDIRGDRLYVAVADGSILGLYCYDNRGDENYNEIFEGQFVWDAPYAAIHRVAVAPEAKGKGIGGHMVAHAVKTARAEGFSHMRGDTHRKNASMQKMMTKNGFQKRGIIYLGGRKTPEDERFAFEMEF